MSPSPRPRSPARSQAAPHATRKSLLLSVSLHAAAVVGVACYASPWATPKPPSRVVIREQRAAPPPSPVVPPPEVVVEQVQGDPLADVVVPLEPVEPEPTTVAERPRRCVMRGDPTLDRIVARVEPAQQPPEHQQPEETPPPSAPIASPPSARVEAAPRSDNAPPTYPRESRRRQEQGEVLLLVRIGVDGCVRSVEVARSSGYARLDRAATHAVRGWRFEPAREAGQAVEGETTVTVEFRLDG